MASMLSSSCWRFLSTPSARRATSMRKILPSSYRFLSTPSARRATGPAYGSCHPRKISIHALREEGDGGYLLHVHGEHDFYPRPPRGGRRCSTTGTSTVTNFYPRPPRGGRRPADRPTSSVGIFLSTPSARRATIWVLSRLVSREISIHALREEGDPRPLR